MTESTDPTVVLVHGAFADASSYAAVIPELLHTGQKVVAPAVPNRGLITDGAYIASLVAQIPGPVILVGHSYGGAVITVAGDQDNVRALVYLAGYALTEGESLGELQGRFPDSDLATALVHTPFPTQDPAGTGTDVSVDPARFPAIFAADVDPDLARILAFSQRPLAARAFADTAPVAAWRTKPSWGLVATADHAINPDVERFGYRRAGMTTVEVHSSHLVMLAHPKKVTELISQAVHATRN